jgi:hypothetical protein
MAVIVILGLPRFFDVIGYKRAKKKIPLSESVSKQRRGKNNVSNLPLETGRLLPRTDEYGGPGDSLLGG